jgi:uncharacterized protein
LELAGTADLPLHSGHVPEWLLNRMGKMASAIAAVIVEDFGPEELLRRIGDPLWFQSFGCVLGFDWHSSGLTTVVCGVLRDSLDITRHGVAAVGGKGLRGRSVPQALRSTGLDEDKAVKLEKASRLSAKVDNNALQDGYSLYQHTLFFTERGEWAVVQQGLNHAVGYARRYHWIGENIRSFVEEPHSGILGDRCENLVLNMVSHNSCEAQRASLDLIKEGPTRLIRMLNIAISRQASLDVYLDNVKVENIPFHLRLHRRINWDIVRRLYEAELDSYEELIGFPGVGASTVRALALVSSIIYGSRLDWSDPIGYSFAFGGKDGVPYPVSGRRIDEVTAFLAGVVEKADVDHGLRRAALKRLYVMMAGRALKKFI